MDKLLRRVWSEDQGEDLVEYALLAALLSTALVATLNSFTVSVSELFSEAVSAM